MPNYAKFKITDVFHVNNTHSILGEWIVANSGKSPYVTASEANNAVSTYIDYDKSQIEEGNSIMIGGKTLVITYQPKDYYSNDSHNLSLIVKDPVGRKKETQLFLVAALYKSLKPKYTWGNSISKKKIQNDTVDLPIDSDLEIDYEYMFARIRELELTRIRELVAYLKVTGLTDYRLTADEEDFINNYKKLTGGGAV